MAIVGVAYVSVRTLSDNLSKDIKKDVEKSLKDAEPTVDKESQKLGDSMNKSMSKGFKKSADKDKTVSKSIKKNVQKTQRDVDHDFSALGASMFDNFRVSFDNLLKKDTKTHASLQKWAKKFDKIAIPWKGLLFAGAVPAAQAAVQLVSTFVAQSIKYINQLGPAIAAGALVAANGVVALGAAFGAVKLAMAAQTPMLARFKEVLQGVKDQFINIGASIQTELLPRLGQALVTSTKMIPVLTKGLTGVGKAVGEVAIQFTDMVTSATNLGRINTLLGMSAVVTKDAGSAMTSLADAALALLAAAAPLTMEFSKWVAHLAGVVDKSIQAADASGKLAVWMQRAGDTLKELGRIAGNFGRGIVNIFKAGNRGAQDMFASLERVSKKFADWTASVKGQNALAKWFDTSAGMAKGFGKVMKAAGDAIQKIFLALDPGTTGQFMDSLVHAFDALGKAAPGIADLASAIGDVMAVAASTGMLDTMVDLFNTLAKIFLKIMETPILGQIVALMLIFSKFIGPIIKVVGFLLKMWRVIQLIAWVFEISAGVLLGWIAVIALVIAAVIWLIFHWKTVKKVAVEVWDAVVAAAKAAWKWLSKVFQDIWDKAKEIWQNISDSVGDIWDSVKDVWDKVKDKIKEVVDDIQQRWDKLVSHFQPIIDFFKTTLPTVLDIFRAIWQVFWTIITLPVQIAIGLIRAGWNALFEALRGPVSTFVSWVGSLWNSLVGVVTGLTRNLVSGVTGLWNGLVNWFRAVTSGLMKSVQGMWNNLVGFIRGVVGGVVNWIRSVWGQLTGILSGPISRARSAIGGIISGIQGAFSGLWSGIASGASRMASGVQSGINRLVDVVNRVVGGINHVIDLANKLPGVSVGKIATVKHARAGGVFPAVPGGTLTLIGEAGRSERVEPLDSQGLSKRDRDIMSSLVGAPGATSVRVFIGDRELTDIVRTEIDYESRGTALALTGGRR